MSSQNLPITILLAVKNEAANLPKSLKALRCAQRVVLVDSWSSDGTREVIAKYPVEIVQFEYHGGYPKKRQWALDNIEIDTPWTLLLDADEVVPDALWDEIEEAIRSGSTVDAFMITKGFHFLGKRMKYGGFSHSALLLFRTGSARFERLLEDHASGLDMEVHERVVVEGTVGKLETPLIHEDFKGLEAYIARHNQYSTWEAQLRDRFLNSGVYGEETIEPKAFGNSQERRRWLKALIIRLPFEHCLWFCYHYFVRLGFLEGRRGLIASQIRSSYIAQVRAKMFELQLHEDR